MPEALPSPPRGVVWARRAGLVFGLALIVLGARDAFGAAERFELFRACYWAAFGALLLAPYSRLPEGRAWKTAFAVLCFACAAFVFVMIAKVLFEYIEASERGQKPGIPGFEGAMIFVALMQPPAALFLRRPELLD